MGSASLVSVVLTFILHTVTCEPSGVTQHNLNRIFLDICKANQGKNLAVAPLPFRFALCRLAAVATGETKREIMSVLEIKKDADITKCFSSLAYVLSKAMETDMTLLNKMYVNYTSDINDAFTTDASKFGVTVSKIGFNYNQAATSFVNREFDSKTLKRIRDVLETRDIGTNSSILLVNGLYFKATWESDFDQKRTKKKIFRGKDKTSEVMMMNRVQACMYLDDSKKLFKAIALHLLSYGLSVMFVMPYPESSLDRLVTSLTENPNYLSDIRKRMTWKDVNVFLPRFKIKAGLDWTQYLSANGLNLTTSRNNTGLNSILKNKNENNMYVSKAKQKVFMQVDEVGSVRQYKDENARDIDYNALPDNALDHLTEFMGDRPFLFFVSLSTKPELSDSSAHELVAGVFNGPEE